MKGLDSEGMDRALAQFMMTSTSKDALRMIREARSIVITVEGSENVLVSDLASAHYHDCLKLHDACLTLEADPEIVGRNLTARIISGIFPLLNSIEEFRSFEDRTVWDMVINSLGIVAEVATATQYLEATRLSANAHSESALVKIEERLVRIARNNEGDLEEQISLIEEFMDEVRGLNINPRKKSFIPFILWLLISVISYKQLKDVMVQYGTIHPQLLLHPFKIPEHSFTGDEDDGCTCRT